MSNYYADLYGHDHPRANEAQPDTFKPLNDQQFFHGTSHGIKGDTLKPPASTGNNNYDNYEGFSDAPLRRKSVFAVDSEKAAWSWAANSRGQGRMVVHEVKPLGDVVKDHAGSGHMEGSETAVMSPEAKIVDTHWIPPRVGYGPDAGGPIQGTLPPLNWKRHIGDPSDHEAWSTANAIPMAKLQERDHFARKTTADYAVEDDTRRENIGRSKNLRDHPQLFSTDQFKAPVEGAQPPWKQKATGTWQD